jgi:hypothetical protein
MHLVQIIILVGWIRHHHLPQPRTVVKQQTIHNNFLPNKKKEQLNQFPSNINDEEFPPFDDQTAALNIDDSRLESDEEEEQMKVCCICTRNVFVTIEFAWP